MYVNDPALLPWRSTIFIQLKAQSMNFSILIIFYSRKLKEFGGLKNNWYGVCEAEKISAYSDPLHLISLDYFNGPHSLKLKITLCHENDGKYFPEKPKMSIYEYLFFL